MGAEDVRRQSAERLPHEAPRRARCASSSPAARTLKDAMNEALRDWITNVARHVLHDRLGRGAASVSADRARLPVGDRHRGAPADPAARPGGCPTRCIACVGGGSNAMGLFHAVPRRREGRARRRRGGRARPRDRRSTPRRSRRGQVGVLHGKKTYLLQDETGQIREAHSISAGLDYPGVGPEHALPARQRPRDVRHRRPTTRRSRRCRLLARDRGHHPGARERARDRARDPRWRRRSATSDVLVVNLSGRGDKDMDTVASHLGVQLG